MLSSFQALVNGEVTKEGDKITIRTKRQQCVCIVVSPGSNQLQCNCDNAQVGVEFARRIVNLFLSFALLKEHKSFVSNKKSLKGKSCFRNNRTWIKNFGSQSGFFLNFLFLQ